MTKVSLKDMTRELITDADKVLEDSSRVRSQADALTEALRQAEERFLQEDAERSAKARREEQQRIVSSHSKAFTMPDDEVQPAAAPPAAPAEKPAAIGEAAPAEKPKKEDKPAPVAKTDAPAAAAVQKPAVKPAPAKVEKPAAAPRPVAQATAAQASAVKKAEAAPQARPAVPAAQHPAARPAAPAAPARPAIGQIISRPGQAMPQQQVGLAPNVIRAPRPVQPGTAAPRPQGPYGRPANPQGPYGRPANPQGSYGRPANPQGPYGRPAPGAAPRPGVAAGRPGMAGAPRPGGPARPAAGMGARPVSGPRRPSVADIPAPMGKERVSNYDPNKKNYVRQYDPEHVSRSRKQQARGGAMNYAAYDEDGVRGGRKRSKKPSVQQQMAPIKIETAYMGSDTITVRDLTERIGKPAGEILKKLLLLGNMATINTELDFDTASLICQEFEITLEKRLEKTAEDSLVEEDFDDQEENLEPRPPVVTIMGHVDHGKTSLLDYIRASRVTAGEAGGITQHIGAYTVSVDGRPITFLDTPGHEAFTAMRARGAQATDIAILVVAADDSVMPQTIEAINHAKAAEVPIIVAINKIDKPQANPDKVKQDLTQHGLIAEEWGGDVIMTPVSAHTGEGVDTLLEMILLQADMLQLRANPNRLGRGIIIEAKLDKARGPLATVLLQNGTLHVGDNIVAGTSAGRIRALINDRGEKVESAGPSMPVEIMGFDDVPAAGDEMRAVGDDRLSRQVAAERREKIKASREANMSKISMENLFSNIEAGKLTTLNLIIKADVQGSVEAVKQAMEKLTNDQVRVRVLHSGAGAITKDDVNLANAFDAIIIGFNIRPDASAREAADREKVDVRLYTIIYDAVEDMEKAMKGLLVPEFKEVILGHAEIRNTFKITGAGVIAGCYVQDGKMQRNAKVRLLRENRVVFEGKLSSLKHYKEDVKEMAAGFECGMSLEGHNDLQLGDVVECYIMEEIKR